MPAKRIIPVLVVSIAIGFVALFLMSVQMPVVQAANIPAHADPNVPGTIRCVKPGGGGGCYSTIQAAVTAASNGDTIHVAQGIYHEAVLVEKSVILEGGWDTTFTSRNWDTNITKIDALGTGSVIRISGNVTTTIDGFVLTGGDASSYLGWGGGILADGDWEHGGLITIRHNLITDNVACRLNDCQGYGGGIMIYSNRSIIEYNQVISNVANLNGRLGGKGGGIVIWGVPVVSTIAHNLVFSNTAILSQTAQYGGGEGGGVWAEGSSDLAAFDNEIRGNIAAVRGEGYGGGVYALGDWYDNQILSNTASITGTGYGGGVYAYYTPDFNDNLVQGNLASRKGDGSGGGVYAAYLKDAYRNTIVNNYATRGGGVFYKEYTGQQTFSGNLVARNWATGLNLVSEDGGGGISSKADRVEITDNEFINNNAFIGGGILVTSGDRYRVGENAFVDNWAVAGGGLYIYSATGTIIQNQVDGNNAIWWGGGMYLAGKASPRMDSNVVINNVAGGYSGFAGGGIMLAVEASTRVTLTNHIIARNTINSGIASGVHCFSGSCALIHCTIVDNKLGANPGEGVRIGATGGTNLLWNSIIAGHSTGVVMGGTAVATLDYNDYYDNATHVSGTGEGTHHYHLDPQFVNRATGDYHLTGTSLLINVGDSILSTPLDFEGDPRLEQPDIGADEYIFAHIYLPVVGRNWSDFGPS
jgi:hypothetical protein